MDVFVFLHKKQAQTRVMLAVLLLSYLVEFTLYTVLIAFLPVLIFVNKYPFLFLVVEGNRCTSCSGNKSLTLILHSQFGAKCRLLYGHKIFCPLKHWKSGERCAPIYKVESLVMGCNWSVFVLGVSDNRDI